MPSVFFSYSHVDAALRDQLEKQLSVLKRQGVIETWHDRRVGAGDAFEREIDEHIDGDDIILLLISADFLASDYCYDIEMKRAMERHERGEAIVIPVILRACEWKHAPFGKLKGVPEDGRPIKQWSDVDAAFLQVAQAVRDAAGRAAERRRAIVSPVQTLPHSVETSMLDRSATTSDIYFDEDCIVNVHSVAQVVKSGAPLAKIHWHASILEELKRYDEWWTTFDRNFEARKPEQWTMPDFQKWATRTRRRLRHLRDLIQKEVDAAPQKMRAAQACVESECESTQIEVLTQLAGFNALQLIRLLQRGDQFLPDPDWKDHSAFPTLPRVPDWLIDLEPENSALGAHVFGEDHFLLSRVGENENVYEYVVLPRNAAERLQDNGRDESVYFRWVIPQWIHYGYERKLPSKEHWNVYALRDGLGRESWSSSSPRPWR
ncbi:TIR domain-containing protein [Rhizobium mongolense USDA 1844]|nr:TIR domain-containing protein [Rhizobium mongolense USDA 1844]